MISRLLIAARRTAASFVVLLGFISGLARAETIYLVVPTNAAPRIQFGADKLGGALREAGAKVIISATPPASGRIISLIASHDPTIPAEGFRFTSAGGSSLKVLAGDDSGILYGCLELADRLREAGHWPGSEDVGQHDAPALKLRGTCVGLQKPYLLPGRHVYEYPLTPELFPWFYDRQLWTQYLDVLVQNRQNTLYIWSGHPFASLVRLPDYPEAVEVSPEVFRRNQEMYHWLVGECDRRGIWLVQMFYNILLSKPFAEAHGLSTQLSAPEPQAADYTRKSIAEFVREYPDVGLLVCLGEALRGTPNQLEWCTNVILPGVLDGMKAGGLKAEPPVVIRTHAMDPMVIMPAAYQVYSNLFTETKYNGESLTTWEPRGKDQLTHLAMSRLGAHLANIHILSNLEPFRYGDVTFIQKCVQASRDRLGASGIHLYPLSYWNWPDAPDTTVPALHQWDRDWIWFAAWARYEWNPDRPAATEHAYWVSRLTEMYGTPAAAEQILTAYDASGEVAPRLIRRFGITEGNRQTLSLGMTLDQLVNPDRYGAIEDLWLSQAPPGERLDEFMAKEWRHQPHVGETPESILTEVDQFSAAAVAALEAAAPLVTRNRAEFERLQNDVRCIRAMEENYAAKVRAAELVLRYQSSHDLADLDQAANYLSASLEAYRRLAKLGGAGERYANSMQTSQRKIPVSGGAHGQGANYLWSQLVPLYERELADFQKKVASLHASKNGPRNADRNSIPAAAWPAAKFQLLSPGAETYTVQVGAKVFTDRNFAIQQLAPELAGLKGIRFSHETAKKGRLPTLEFSTDEPVLVLVGYFNSKQKAWLPVPELENAAQADERGGAEPVLDNAVAIDNCPNVSVHAFRYSAGRQKLELIGRGSFVVLGVVPQSVNPERRDAQIGTQ